MKVMLPSTEGERASHSTLIAQLMRWHFHLTPPADGAANMALDEALMHRAARTGEAVFRIYGWSTPTLSLGRNQRARDAYDRDKARGLGIGFVRRPTGGRALLHHRELTYSATLPASDPRAASAAYEFINEVLLDGLATLGVEAQRAVGAASIGPGPRPCFDVPSAHEIAIGDRKLVGSAQWRRGGALLQHGSILVEDDQPLIARLMYGQVGTSTRAATLADALGRTPGFDEIAAPIVEALARRASQRIEPLLVDDVLNADCARLRSVYLDDGWTWRR